MYILYILVCITRIIMHADCEGNSVRGDIVERKIIWIEAFVLSPYGLWTFFFNGSYTDKWVTFYENGWRINPLGKNLAIYLIEWIMKTGRLLFQPHGHGTSLATVAMRFLLPLTYCTASKPVASQSSEQCRCLFRN